MKYNVFLKVNKIINSKSFLFTVLFSFLLIIVSNVQWIIDEYINKRNDYSVFYKLISFTDLTKGATVFYWVYPLIASIPYSLWKYHEGPKTSGKIINYSIVTESIMAFLQVD